MNFINERGEKQRFKRKTQGGGIQSGRRWRILDPLARIKGCVKGSLHGTRLLALCREFEGVGSSHMKERPLPASCQNREKHRSLVNAEE